MLFVNNYFHAVIQTFAKGMRFKLNKTLYILFQIPKNERWSLLTFHYQYLIEK